MKNIKVNVFLASLVLVVFAVFIFIGNRSLFADEIIVSQDTDFINNPVRVSVKALVGGNYTVTIPKEILLVLQDDGSYVGDYTVDVDGEIANEAYISVIPQDEVTLSSVGKDDVPVTVFQPVRYFRSKEYTESLEGVIDTVKIGEGNVPEAMGLLSVKEGYQLSPGLWSGSLLFDISLNWDSGAIGVSTVSGGDVLNGTVSGGNAKVK